MKKTKPELLSALESLKSVSGTDNISSIDLAFEVCHTATDDVHYAHALYREIGEIALRLNRWTTAKEFAAKSLLSVPSYGAALKVMGLALRGQGRLSEAAICHRYGLPESVQQQYFKNDTYRAIRSDKSSHVNCLAAYPSDTRPLTPPISVDNNLEWELLHKELRSSEASTFHLSGAHLWFDGFNSVVWDSFGQMIEDASRGLVKVVQCALSTRSPIALSGRTCLLGNRNSDNYYHWMNDVLPRVQVLTTSGIDVKSIRQFIVNPLKHNFQFETLKKLEIDASQLYFTDDHKYFQCDELFVPTFGSNALGMGQGKWIPEFLGSRFLEDCKTLSTHRLYISRKNATGRAIENESELEDFLTEKGFRTVYLENMSVAEQSRLFHSAAVVISSHGAGLSNIAFCQKGATIIELYKDHIAPCYWITSVLQSLQHAVLYCGDDHGTDMAHGSENYHVTADKRRRSDFSVNINKLKTLFVKLKIS